MPVGGYYLVMSDKLLTVVAKIKAEADRQGYTRNALAVAAEVPPTTVTRLFAGERMNPHLSTVIALAAVLGMKVDVKRLREQK